MTEANSGSLSIEFLLALSLFAVVLSVVARSAQGLQDLVAHAAVSSEALQFAEQDAAKLRTFTGALHTLPTPVVVPQGFTMQRAFNTLAPCAAAVSTSIGWSVPHSARIDLVTPVVSGFSLQTLGNDCSTVGLTSNWNAPSVASTQSWLTRMSVHGVDVVVSQGKRVAFLATSSTQPQDPDLLVVDLSNANAPVVVAGLNTGNGLFAVDALNAFVYAVQNNATGQLQTIDAANLQTPVLLSSKTLPGVSGSFPQGRSVYGYNNKVYVGTYETAGPEFHIFDVANPANPQFLGSKALNHSVRQIVARDEVVNGASKVFAYVASSANGAEVQVLDVTNPTAISEAAVVDLPGGGSATALYLAGQYLYVARQQVTAEPALAIISLAEPLRPKLITTYDVQLKSGSVVNGLAVSNFMLVLTTTDSTASLVLCKLSETLAVNNCTKHALFSNPGRIDFQDDFVFMPAGNSLVTLKSQ